MFSTPARATKGLFVSETGNIGLKLLPLGTGFAYNDEAKWAWGVVNALKVSLRGVEGEVLPISERSCVPLDPYNVLSKEDREAFTNIKAIATESFQSSYAKVADEDRKSVNAQLIKTMLWLSFIAVMIAIVGLVLVKRG